MPLQRGRMPTMRLRWAFPQLFIGLALGCGNPQPVLESVAPAQANSNRDVRLTLEGHDFIPATLLDPLLGRRIATSEGFEARVGKGKQWAKLTRLDWLSSGVLAGSLPSSHAQLLPLGALDVEVTDPRGQVTRLPDSFHELGSDTQGPSLYISASTEPLVAGSVLRGTIHASEAPSGEMKSLEWIAFEREHKRDTVACHFPPGASEVDCDFLHNISSNLQANDVVRIEANAKDIFDNSAKTNLLVTLCARPVLKSIFPSVGGIAGGTDVVVKGEGILPGSTVTIGGELLSPNGGIRVDDTASGGDVLISGYVPAHAKGDAQVTVHTPLGDTTERVMFTYRLPPTISSIVPNVGDAAGATRVTIEGSDFSERTLIFFGTSLDAAIPLVGSYNQGEVSIVGLTPPGNGSTTVWAFDRELGFSELPGGFTWRTP